MLSAVVKRILSIVFLIGSCHILNSEKILSIPIHGTINYAQECIVRRGLKLAERHHYQYVLFDINTLGGNLESALNILDTMRHYKGEILAYIHPQAISAGAIITMACDRIFFHPDGVIGASAVIQEDGRDLGKNLSMKVDSYLLAKMRVVTEKHPFRYALIKAMIDPKDPLTICDKTFKKDQELLTLTAQEACWKVNEAGDVLLANGVAGTHKQLLKKYFPQHQLQEFKLTPFESFVQYVKPIIPFLTGIGIFLIILEVKTPGFGLLGILGIACFASEVLLNVLLGFVGHEAIIALIVSVLLLLSDLMFFGTFIVGFLGLILAIGTLWWSNIDWWPTTIWSWSLLLSPAKHFVGAFLLVLAICFVLWKLGWLKKGIHCLKLDAHLPQTPKETTNILGQQAIAITPLLPSGKIKIGTQVFDAHLEEGFALPETKVVVIGKKDFEWIVKVID